MKEEKERQQMKTTDFLALERTKLANERTFLAYFRTFVVFLSSGFVILKIDAFQKVTVLGYFFMGIAIVLLCIGTVRFFYVKKNVKNYFKEG